MAVAVKEIFTPAALILWFQRTTLKLGHSRSSATRTRLLLLSIITLATYLVFFDPHDSRPAVDVIDIIDIEQELESGNPVQVFSYKSPFDKNIFQRKFSKSKSRKARSNTAKYHRVWSIADRLISKYHLWPNGKEVKVVLRALATARIVGVDVVDIGEYESGTSDKWLFTLEGGQRAIAKVVWEEKGEMKRGGLCNYGFEMPSSEIAAFHLHRWYDVGFNNRSYCNAVRKKEPYNNRAFFYDLFDFSVLDAIMYHFDSKHYTIDDNSDASGLAVRLDHGRAFCASDREDDRVFLAPLNQCCTLRKSTYENLLKMADNGLGKELKKALENDPIAPILKETWFPVINQRLRRILEVVHRCIRVNGKQRVLVSDTQ